MVSGVSCSGVLSGTRHGHHQGGPNSLEQEMEWSVRSKWGLECVMARSEGSQGSLV